MRTRRKTWSLPLALVTALLLVGLLGAVVLAQSTRNSAPRIASLDDLEKRIGEPVTTIDLMEEITDTSKVSMDHDNSDTTPNVDVPEQLAVTVMVLEPGRTTVVLPGNYNGVLAPAVNNDIDHDGDTGTDGATPLIANVPSAVAVWWDGLTDAQRRSTVGATLIDNTALEDEDDEICDSTAWCFDFDHDGGEGTADIRRIKNYVLVPETENVVGEFEALAEPEMLIVTQAFHWDMLDASEMKAVAKAAGYDDYNGYGKRFGNLGTEAIDHDDDTTTTDISERAAVQALYTNGFLHRGVPSAMTVVANIVLDPGDADNDFQDGRIGEGEITVKVSDSYGRLVTSSNDIGESFTVDVQGTKLEQLIVSAPTGEEAIRPGTDDVRLIEETETVGDVTTVVSRTLRISGDAKEVVIISIRADNAGDGAQPIDGAFDTTRGRLRNGGELGLSVNPTGTRADRASATEPLTADTNETDTFTIKLDDFSKLRDDGKFTFRAYALTEEVNWVEMEFTIELAVGNQPPEFTGTPDDSKTISEALARGEEIYDFDATDPDHTTGITFSLRGDTTDVDGNVVFTIDNTGKLTVGPGALNYQGDQTDGCPDPDAEEDEEADAEEADAEAVEEPCEETGDDNENNIYELSVVASDGELTESVPFTITVEDSPDIPATGSRSFKINENKENTVENAGDDDEIAYLKDRYDAKATVQLLNNEGTPLQGGYEYVVDKRNSPEDAVDLFDINADGSLFLNDDQTIDYETEDRYLLSVKATGDDGVFTGAVIIEIVNVPETPMFADDSTLSLRIIESASVGDSVLDTKGTPDELDDVPAVVTAEDDDAGQTPSYSLVNTDDSAYTGGLFAIGAANGLITVAGVLDAEDDGMHSLKVKASDADGLDSYRAIDILIGDANEAPNFESPEGPEAEKEIPESMVFADGAVIAFTATDPDRNDLSFTIREGAAKALFTIHGAHKTDRFNLDDDPIWAGELRVADGVALDYDSGYNVATGYRVHIEVQDTGGLSDTLAVDITLGNVNDNVPVFDGTPAARVTAIENDARGTVLGSFPASDKDGDPVGYSLKPGAHDKSFDITDTGDLLTVESLDYDTNTPCPRTGCVVTIVATDNRAGSDDTEHDVTISVSPQEDSVSTLKVTKANPVPGTSMGRASTALAGTKAALAGSSVLERPSDIPAISYMDPRAKLKVYPAGPMNFVETEWANWGTVLRIEVTSESPGATCGAPVGGADRNNNQCVVIIVNSDSGDDSVSLAAYRSASVENKFVAAVMLVELDGDATDSDGAVYKHSDDGGVPRLKVDEEDEIEIEFGNLRSSIDVENEPPEIDNFSPADGTAFDDADVEYAFTVTDAHSGLPEPEDLPDLDGDDAYTPVVALISRSQCETHAGMDESVTKDDGDVVNFAAQVHENETLYCPGEEQDGEYDASAPVSSGTYGFAPVRDDKDFDEIDDGFDVETTIVLTENRVYYVTFIVCDNAGNCTFYDPEGNDPEEELAKITVDTENPEFAEARTGVKWDSTDNEYDDDRSYIQVLFDELTALNAETVEIDDFVVEGHSIKSVYVFENPDDDDVAWADSGKYAEKSPTGTNGRKLLYQDIENTVFIELEDELLADETPDVTLVPNGVEDGAGNEQDDGEQEADDWISPKFTIVSIVSPRETTQSQVLAGRRRRSGDHGYQ